MQQQIDMPRGDAARSKATGTGVIAMLVLVLSGTLGCGGPASVSGNVVWNGSPMPYGAISFENQETKKSVVGTVEDGRFEVDDVDAGPNLVRFSVGERPEGTPAGLLKSAPTGKLVEVGKSVREIGGGSQKLNFKLNPR